MTNLLNNKLVVTGLVLGACAIIYFRVVGPVMDMYFPEKLEAAVIDVEEVEIIDEYSVDYVAESTEQELQLANAKYNLTQIDVRHLRWNETPSRNPFSSSGIEPLQAVREVPKVVSQSTALPIVSAIVNSPQLKFAVINGEILKEGDVFDKYRLSRIESNNISLIHLSTGHSKQLAVRD